MIEKQFCAQVSRDAQEPFLGTAPRVDIWFLLEYTGTWGSSAIEDSLLPDRVKGWIARSSQLFPHFRAQLIRQQTPSEQAITCFIGIAQENRQLLYRFQLESYENLLTLNMAALIAGDPCYDEYVFHDPLFLICTHGKHDLCCSKFGMPVYLEAVKQGGECAWQTSHLGGDKFAANMLCLPHGIYYGRVIVLEVEAIIANYRKNMLYMEKYRGRTCYTLIEQVAEHFLRIITNKHAINILQLLAMQHEGNETYKVSFRSLQDSKIYRLTIIREIKETCFDTTCNAKGKNKTSYYQLSRYEVLEEVVVGST